MNLLSIVLFVKNSNLRTRAMYLVITLTVPDMFVGGIATVFIVFHFLPNGQGHPTDLFLTISVLQRKFCWLGTEVSAVLLGSKVY